MTRQVSQTHRTTPLEKARKSQGFTREQLATATGLSARTIYRLERRPHDRRPLRSTLLLLAIALTVEPEDLFPGERRG